MDSLTSLLREMTKTTDPQKTLEDNLDVVSGADEAYSLLNLMKSNYNKQFDRGKAVPLTAVKDGSTITTHQGKLHVGRTTENRAAALVYHIGDKVTRNYENRPVWEEALEKYAHRHKDKLSFLENNK